MLRSAPVFNPMNHLEKSLEREVLEAVVTIANLQLDPEKPSWLGTEVPLSQLNPRLSGFTFHPYNR